MEEREKGEERKEGREETEKEGGKRLNQQDSETELGVVVTSKVAGGQLSTRQLPKHSFSVPMEVVSRFSMHLKHRGNVCLLNTHVTSLFGYTYISRVGR